MKRFFSMFLVALMLICTCSFVFADDEVVASEIGETITEDTSDSSTSSSSSYTLSEELQPENVLGLEDITVDDLADKLTDKGMDIVYILKIVGQYVCLAIFIVSCITALIGIFGNKRLLSASIIGALISGVAYACIMYGETIVVTIATWAASW